MANIPVNDSLPSLPHLTEEEKVMTPAQRRFYLSEACVTARQALQDLVDNPLYNTESTYFSGHKLDFIDRHLYHLSMHPATNVTGYISNLKLMTNIKERD